jgi:SMI1 / KNR4 family (SUKH-1)
MENKYDAHMQKIATYFLRGNLMISPEIINDLEKEIGFTLPDDYRHFLSRYGFSAQRGYATFPDIHRPGKPGGGIDVFYGINPKESRDLFRKYKGFQERIPSDMLPIAESPGGQICLGLAGSDRGKVFWWDRSEPHDDPRKNLRVIGDDFDTFINSLWVE